MSDPYSEPELWGSDREIREDKSLEWLVEPRTPVVFDPPPGTPDMPDPGGDTLGGGSNLPPSETAE